MLYMYSGYFDKNISIFAHTPRKTFLEVFRVSGRYRNWLHAHDWDS